MSLKGKKVLIFAGPLYEDLELWYPKIRLEEEGVRTVVAGIGEKTYQGKRGYPVTVDTSVDQVEARDFDGLVIPGGFAPDQLRRFDKVLQLTREIYQAGKPVAFICHAGWVPISAKILKGKRATSVRAIKDDMENAGVVWEDSAVVVDGNVISSRTPADLPQFCRALIAALERGPQD
jgi:protease I